MQLIVKRLTEIYPYEKNPRKNDGAVDAVAESIRQCGYIAPIIVDECGVILAGHTRYKALLKLGYTECQVAVAAGLSEEKKRKYRILDNKTNELAEWDFELLVDELDGLDFGDLKLDWGIEDANRELVCGHKEAPFQETISVVVSCENDGQAEELFQRLSEEGYDCHISTL